MSGTVTELPVAVPAAELRSPADSRSFLIGRFSDYVELTKPRIGVMALVTVVVGFLLAQTSSWNFTALWDALFGIALVAASSSTLNQCLERNSDRWMRRTRNRPLPAGRLTLGEACGFGLLTGSIGLFWLAFRVNLPTAGLAALTLFLYVAIYTPLKSRTHLNTVVGAIPGALPPVLGWTAAGGELGETPLVLFAVLFLWQFPHFMAIAWLYRDDYAIAGLKMLPTTPFGRDWIAGLVATGYALALIPVGLLPSHLGMAGSGSSVGVLLLGLGYLFFSVEFFRKPSEVTARRLLWSSLIYLPTFLLILVGDYYRLLS